MVTEADTAFVRHPLSAMFGGIPEDEFEDMVTSIGVNGMREPIMVVNPVMEGDKVVGGEILDGWHRYRAALDAGVEPEFDPFYSDVDGTAEGLVVDKNLYRRHLSKGERARILVEVYEWRKHGDRSRDATAPTNAELAEKGGVSERTIARAKAEKRAEDEPVPDAPDAPKPPRVSKSERLEAELAVAKSDLQDANTELDNLREEHQSLRRVTESTHEMRWQNEIDRQQELLRAERAQRETAQNELNDLMSRLTALRAFVKELRELAYNNDCEAIKAKLLDE